MDLTSSLDLSTTAIRRSYLSRDLYTFCSEGLGYSDMRPQPHAELCAFVESYVPYWQGGSQNKGMLLVPRRCFKTSIASVGFPLYVLSKYPNARILIVAHTHEYAMEILSFIKDHMERTRTFIDTFGDWRKDSIDWTEKTVTINRRTKPLAQSSIATSGVDKPMTGGHYDIIIMDDLHSEKNITSDKQLRKVKNAIRYSMLIVGTRWHFADAYQWVIDRRRDDIKRHQPVDWEILVHKAENPDGTLYFPDKLNRAFLDNMRKEIGDEMYANFYENEPIAGSMQVFPRSLMQTFQGRYHIQDGMPVLELADGRKLTLRVTLALDPALTAHDRSDASGFTIVGTDSENNWWILWAEAFKGQPAEVVKHCTALIRHFQPTVFSLETVAAGLVYKPMIQKEFEENEIRIRFVDYDMPTKIKKFARIEALQPRFRNRQIFIKHELEDLITQLTQYPQLLHFDILDSLAQHLEITKAASPDEISGLAQSEEDYDDMPKGRKPLVLVPNADSGRG